MALQPDLPLVEVSSRAQWREWLTEHQDQPTGVWAKLDEVDLLREPANQWPRR